ncbi:MAG: putative heme-binding protein [Planctomycetaceae bacterium]|nr:putative heme-binding protein [Planctomycetaceae bacterium]
MKLIPSLCLAGLLFTSLPATAQPNHGRIYTQQPAIAASVNAPDVAPLPTTLDSQKLEAGPVPFWIWGPDQNTRYVARKVFSGTFKAARVRTSADNVVRLSINGQRIGESNEWSTPLDADVQKYLKEGDNLIEAVIVNNGGPAAFVFKMGLTTTDDKTNYVVSDHTWEVGLKPDSKVWTKAQIVAMYGDQPWGKVLSAAPANLDRGLFNVPAGFQVERLFTVPQEKLGSWVCITLDDRGRIIASEQGASNDNERKVRGETVSQGLCRITPPPIGSQEPTKVEHLTVKMTGAQGLLFANGSLYVSANGGPGSGLYRLRDTDNDDQFDEVVKLREFRGTGEHGPHGLRLGPDGKSIYVVCGNHTLPPFDRKTNAPPQTMGGIRAEQLHATAPEGFTSRIPLNWDEDLLLSRQWDSNGHAAGIVAPGGWVAKTDFDGKTWEMVSVGYRNQYDFAFNADGEMFVYDSDMEWDVGSPWYRLTRVVHATSGSEFGWRSGTGNWPPYYVDSLPPLVDVGPGSPVGVEFGYGTKFPAKFQKALYICDWTFATMYAIHMEPSGAGYKAVKEEFVSRTPLPLTDVVVGRDGALYFTIGGRGAQSELFRVTYTGKESTELIDAKETKDAELRALRHKIEAYHVAGQESVGAVSFLVPNLGHADFQIRYAARIALEKLPVAAWQELVLASHDAEIVITGAVGLARQADVPLKPRILDALNKLDYAKLTEFQQLELIRTYQLICTRLGLPEEPTRAALGAKFEAIFPGASEWHTRELGILMVGLSSPHAANKLIPYLTKERVASQSVSAELLARNRGYGGSISSMLANQPDQLQYHLAYSLRNLKSGWTPEQRKIYFSWFTKARTWSGGNSYQKFLTNISDEAFNNASDTERLAIEALGLRKAYIAPPLPMAKGPGRDYTTDEILKLAAEKLKGRSFQNGQKMFSAARCIVCHRYGGDGGSTGPDLTQLAGRFNLKDLTDSIIDPSKVISDQYKASIIVTNDGKSHTGRIVNDSKESITMVVDAENASKVVEIRKSDIDETTASKVSLMPKELLKQLNEDEVLDLLAYLLSRGNPQDALFRK